MPTYTVHAAKTNLSKLIERAEKGEEVVIARGKKPVARLVPMGVPAHLLRRRAFGVLKGRLKLPDASFSTPFPRTSSNSGKGAVTDTQQFPPVIPALRGRALARSLRPG